MLMAWLRPAPDLLPTRDGGDPLGFRAYANRLAREICPGLTQVTRSTRCFALLALGLKVASRFEESERNERFLRFERLWVLSQVQRFGEGARFAGKLRATRLLEAAQETGEVRLDAPILTTQLSSGLWGSYRRAATLLGLMAATGRGGPRHAKLTAKGNELAEAVTEQVARGSDASGDQATRGFQFKRYLAEDAVKAQVLAGLDKERSGICPSAPEVAILQAQIEHFDRRHEHALGRLRWCFDGLRGQLDLDWLDDARLSPRQLAAVGAARGLRDLLVAVEQPYRRWISEGDEAPEIDQRVWSHAAWDLAKSRGEAEVVHVRDGIRKGGGALRQVHAHHQWLSGLRGAAPWREGDGDPGKAKFVLPDFGLSAPEGLFQEGVNPHAPR